MNKYISELCQTMPVDASGNLKLPRSLLSTLWLKLEHSTHWNIAGLARDQRRAPVYKNFDIDNPASVTSVK